MRQADVDGQTRTAGAAPGARAGADPEVPLLAPPPAPTGTAGDGEREPPSGEWAPPDDKKATMLVHPLVRSEVRALLNRDPSLHGLGYTEFLHAAVEAYRSGRWHPRPGAAGD